MATTTAQMVIVTRHAGALEWLQSKGIEGEVVSTLTSEAIDSLMEGDKVVGVLPLHLMLQCLEKGVEVYLIAFDGQPPRGTEYSGQAMVEARAKLQRFGLIRRCYCTNWEFQFETGNINSACFCGGYNTEIKIGLLDVESV